MQHIQNESKFQNVKTDSYFNFQVSGEPVDVTANEKRIFLCRMNVSRNARRQMRFGDQKVCCQLVLVQYFDLHSALPNLNHYVKVFKVCTMLLKQKICCQRTKASKYAKKCSLSIQFVDSGRNRLYVVDVQMGGTSRYVDSLQEKKSDYCDLTETELSLVRPLLSSRH